MDVCSTGFELFGIEPLVWKRVHDRHENHGPILDFTFLWMLHECARFLYVEGLHKIDTNA